MTRDEIERLEGRELDAAVHEHVFGRRTEWAAPSAEFTFPFDPDARMRIPDYSTDIAAAWQVVEQMRGAVWLQRLGEQFYWRDCGRELQAYAARYGRPLFRCKFGRDSAWGFGLTAPEAICRAALLAVAVETGDDPGGGTRRSRHRGGGRDDEGGD